MEHELLSRARQAGAPLIDDARNEATFVWKGRVQPQLIGDFNDWCAADGAQPHEPLWPGEVEPGLWAYTLALPRDAYIEYSYVVNGRLALDPLNPRSAPNGIGDTNNWFYMPAAAPSPLAHRRRGAPRGTVTRYTVEAGDLIVGARRALYLYQPPVAEPCPLLVVLDGPEYLRRAHLPVIVDNLIAQGRIRPLALAMVDNSSAARFVEYACSDSTVGFLTDIVVPFARDRLNLLDARRQPGAHVVMGASMGGSMALYAAYRAPDVFGGVLAQSGAYNVFNRDLVIFDLLRQGAPRPLRVWMDAGRFESLLDCNRRMHDVLVSRGYDAHYREYNGGHNYPAWRDDLWRGLEWLFGLSR